MSKSISRWIIVVLVGAGLVFAIGMAVRPRPVAVVLGDVALRPLVVSVDQEGKTRIRERYVVSSPLNGRLRRITLDPGDPVASGETTLAVIEPVDPTLLDVRARAEAEARVRAASAAVDRATALADQAEADADLAQRELRQAVAAHEGGGVSDLELERKRQTERSASEALRAARYGEEIATFELELAQSALRYTATNADGSAGERLVIRSPIDGRVLRVFEESDAVVTPGMALVELGDPADLELVIDVLSTDAVKIAPGDRVIVEHWGGEEPLEARVRLVEPAAFTKVSALGIEEQRVNVIADLVSPPDQRRTLGHAYRIEARIVVWESDQALCAPTSALYRDTQGRWNVFVVHAGRAHERVVTIGARNDDLTQILDGLEAGDVVVRHPSDQLADGVRVSPGS